VDGLSARTVTLYCGTIVKTLNEEPGSVRLTELTGSDVLPAGVKIGSIAAANSGRCGARDRASTDSTVLRMPRQV
jgi:hypothetical protein